MTLQNSISLSDPPQCNLPDLRRIKKSAWGGGKSNLHAGIFFLPPSPDLLGLPLGYKNAQNMEIK